MSEARTAILQRIAAANGRTGVHERAPEVTARLRTPVRGPQLSWSEADLTRFVERLHSASATVDRVHTVEAAATAIASHLERERLFETPVLAPHPLLRQLNLAEAQTRPLRADDRCAITVAYAGVAETGSLALLSDPRTPTGFNFLPEFLICLIDARRVVAHLESLWELLRSERGSLPRALNLVTGPSRTADVEQTIQLGAHGPRRLHVVLLEARPRSAPPDEWFHDMK